MYFDPPLVVKLIIGCLLSWLVLTYERTNVALIFTVIQRNVAKYMHHV